jgi:aldose 1-epimerase
MTTPQAVELRQGGLRLALRPDLGGAVAGLWLDDLPVLRSVEPAALTSARESASFALVPYSNRIAERRFQWRNRTYTTAPNSPAEPHSMHGVGWMNPWQVMQHAADRVTLALTHPSEAHWPFAFHAEQTFELSETSLRVTLVLSNIDARETPIGLGWHPFFVRRARSRVHLELTHRWEADAGKLPTHRVEQNTLDADVAVLDLDNCFDGWRGPARIRDEKLSLRLTSSLSRAVIYTPPDHDFFCVEPVSHVNNAIRSDDPIARGLIALPSGESTQAWMQLDMAHA